MGKLLKILMLIALVAAVIFIILPNSQARIDVYMVFFFALGIAALIIMAIMCIK